MAVQSAPPNRTRPDHDLIRQWLSHLDAQEAALLAFRSLLQDLAQHRLTQMDPRRLQARLQASGVLAERLQQDRERLLTASCAQLQIAADDFTLSSLMSRATVERASDLAAARQRLRRVVQQLQRQVATVSWILSEERHLNFLVYQMLGGEHDSNRYDASGRRAVQPASLRFGSSS